MCGVAGITPGFGSGYFLCFIEASGFFLQHHRNAVANRECQPICLADQLPCILAINQGALAQRAYEYFKQLGVHVYPSVHST